MKGTSLVLMKTAVAATLGRALAGDADPGVKGLDELTRQEGVFALSLIHPDADLRAYTKLNAADLNLKFRGKVHDDFRESTGTMIRKKKKDRTVVEGEDLTRLEQVILDACVAELGRSSGLQVVKSPDPQTLILRIAVVDIVTEMAPRALRRAGYNLPLIREGTIVFDLIDAETRVIQARVGERRLIQQTGEDEESPDADALMGEIREWAARATADLCLEIERVQH